MDTPKVLDILFLTNFSEYCYRAIPAVAQLASAAKIRLTLMHVYDAVDCGPGEAQAKLNSFFQEAERYAVCRRVAVPGKVDEVVREHLATWPIDLILAPASDAIGFPRPGRSSRRSRLMRDSVVPVWTVGRQAAAPRLGRPVRNVACWLDLNTKESRQMEFACEFAHKMGAKLHVMCSLPDIHEGTLAMGAVPGAVLQRDHAIDEVLRRCRNSAVNLQLHVAQGESISTVRRMLTECDADIAFFPEETWSLKQWLGLGLPLGDSISCPAVYVGKRVTGPVWSLEVPAVIRQTRTNRVVADGGRDRALAGSTEA